MTINTLSEKLKERTLTNHQQLEKKLMAQMRSTNSIPAYIILLQLFYSYFGAVEDQITAYLTVSQLPDIAERRKTESLANDIKALDGPIVAKAGTDFLPEIKCQQQAFGALYVIEGSTLGGSIISKMMGRQLNITNGAGLSFFNGYGEKSEKMWSAFKHSLDKQAGTEADEELVISAANATFAGFKQFIEANA